MRIVIPTLSTANALEFSRLLVCENTDKKYVFDVSEVKNFEPFPMLLTAAAIRGFRKRRSLDSESVQLRFKEDKSFHYACHMGFFQSAGFEEGKEPGEALGSSTYIPLTKINVEELTQIEFRSGCFVEQGYVIEEEAKRLAKILSQEQAEFQKMLQYLLREAIRNTPEHAETNEVWICGQFWKNRDLAEIAVLDEGIGVFNSLKKNTIHGGYVTTNEEALRWAIKPGVSVSFNPARGQRNSDIWSNSGYGLFMISEICKMADGWFTFVSGEDCIRAYQNKTRTYKAYHNGTAIGMRLKPSKILNYREIINEILSLGEMEARKIKNAFKKGSVPSRGLLS